MTFYKKISRAHSGFTLIELTIVMLIAGLLIASIAGAYHQWLKQEAQETTTENVFYAVSALTTYRDLYGHYPCPASLTASLDNPTLSTAPSEVVYGVATDCEATTDDFGLDQGVTLAGIARTTSTNAGVFNYYNRDTKLTTPQRPIIRIGALPYRTLNITEDLSYDGYNNRLFYAVTEQLTDRAIFDNFGGGISILNEQDSSAIDPPDGGHFIIFSAGENGFGAYSRGGNVIEACSVGRMQQGAEGLETENCDFAANTVFRAAQKGTQEGSRSGLDDVVVYASHKELALWEKNRDISEHDIGSKVSGKIGIGNTASLIPQEDLQVEGTVNIQPDPSIPGNDTSKLISNSVCEFDPNSPECYSASLIAGSLSENTGGMTCPPETPYMTGIQHGRPICTDEITISCPEGTNLVGIKDNGDLDCQYPPCPETNVNICNDLGVANTPTIPNPRTLPATRSEDPPLSITLTFGDAENSVTWPDLPDRPSTWVDYREETYTCVRGEWQHSTKGHCEPCEGNADRVTNVGCSTITPACGGGYTGGNMTITQEWLCPDREWGPPVEDYSQCNCIEGSRSEVTACPEGFNFGNITTIHTFTCPDDSNAAGECIPGEPTDTCECRTDTRNCEIPCGPGTMNNGLNYIPGTETFSCPNGETQPGSWGECVAINPGDQCVCVPLEAHETSRPCTENDGGTCGQVRQTQTYRCEGNASVANPPEDILPIPAGTCRPYVQGNSCDACPAGQAPFGNPPTCMSTTCPVGGPRPPDGICLTQRCFWTEESRTTFAAPNGAPVAGSTCTCGSAPTTCNAGGYQGTCACR